MNEQYQWHSILELPEKEGYYLVFVPHHIAAFGNEKSHGIYMAWGWNWSGGSFRFSIQEEYAPEEESITHWINLPNEPEDCLK